MMRKEKKIKKKKLFEEGKKQLKEIKKIAKTNDFEIIISGEYEKTTLKNEINKLKNISKNKNKILNICFNYDGQTEIMNAIKKIIKLKETKITKKLIKQNLYTKKLPELDLIIRTGTKNRKRLSGFLLWDSSYSELIFRNEYWPDYTTTMLKNDLKEYQKRDRKFGK